MNFHAFRPIAPIAFLAAALAAPLPAQTLDRNPTSPREPTEPTRAEPAPAAPRDDFDDTDANHDGRISAEEYAASPRSAFDRIASGARRGPEGPTGGLDLRNSEGHPERSEFFKKRDTDGDGYLSRDELEAPMPASDAAVKR